MYSLLSFTVVIVLFYLVKESTAIKKVRGFFEDLAKKKGFDPVKEAQRWYSVSQKDVLWCEVFNALIYFYAVCFECTN